MVASPLNTLVDYLTGEFENKAQAAESTAWFVHLRLWQRLVPALSTENLYTLFLEQASVVGNKPPYRQRILQLRAEGAELRGEYFALADPTEFLGAGTNPERLVKMSEADLMSLPGSEAHIQYRAVEGGYQFKSALPDGKLCSFEYGGQRRYVYLGFDVKPRFGSSSGSDSAGDSTGDIELLTYDKGIDPDTGRGLWGALMGPFRMIKSAS